jgi:hypothetical protein
VIGHTPRGERTVREPGDRAQLNIFCARLRQKVVGFESPASPFAGTDPRNDDVHLFNGDDVKGEHQDGDRGHDGEDGDCAADALTVAAVARETELKTIATGLVLREIAIVRG